MENENAGTCFGCIWNGECSESLNGDESEQCEYYTPLDEDELALEEYEEDLKLRVSTYEELVWEQDR